MAINVNHPVGHPLVKPFALRVAAAVADTFADGIGRAGGRGYFPPTAIIIGREKHRRPIVHQEVLPWPHRLQ